MGAMAKLYLPPRKLSGCLFGGVYRDTRSARLCDADRLNHFPASPLVSVTYVISGELRLLGTGEGWQAARESQPVPRLWAAGPCHAPTTSWSPGPVCAITIGVFPDAWSRLGGDAGHGRIPVVLSKAMARFAAHTDPDDGWSELCATLEPHWSEARAFNFGVSDWVADILKRAALSGSGRSLRAVERRIKRATGQTRRNLEFFTTFENLHRKARENTTAGLANIAVDAGFADQSHMGRVVRRATGFSPARLNRAIESEEPFWCYRLLGERF